MTESEKNCGYCGRKDCRCELKKKLSNWASIASAVIGLIAVIIIIIHVATMEIKPQINSDSIQTDSEIMKARPDMESER